MLYDYLFKLLIIGPEFSGKTSFVERICKNMFSSLYEPTIGVEYSSTIVSIFNQLRIKCQFWDTAGKKVFIPIVERYYKGVAGIFIVVDISNPECIKQIKFWIKHFLKYKDGNPVVMIVGNKNDKTKKYLEKEKGEFLTRKHGFLYTEVSSKNDINIIESIILMNETIFNNYNPSVNTPGIRLPPSIDLNENEKLERESCCCIF